MFNLREVLFNIYMDVSLGTLSLFAAAIPFLHLYSHATSKFLPSTQPTMSQIISSYITPFMYKLQQILPRRLSSEHDLQGLTSNLYYRQEGSDLSSLQQSILRPAWDLLERGGKRWRPFLCMVVAELCGVDRREVYDVAAVCEIIHNGTLIVDDVEDDSSVRRGKPCVHLIYGIDRALNAGNFMYFAPMRNLMQKYDSRAMASIYLEQMVNLHLGQGWDIEWHHNDTEHESDPTNGVPTESEYMQMVAHKTGVLVRLAVRLTCAQLHLPPHDTNILIRYAEGLGLAFQIQDDLLNLEGLKYRESKGYNGEDIHQGKCSLMVIHCLRHGEQSDRRRLKQILRKKTTEEGEIREAIEILRRNGSLEYARGKMREIVKECCEGVRKVKGREESKEMLERLVYYGTERQT